MITVRGNFKREKDLKYELVYSDMVQGDPCFGFPSSIYRDSETGIYYSSKDLVNYFPADGVWYNYQYYDWGSDSYMWNEYYINGAEIYIFGFVPSPCSPV